MRISSRASYALKAATHLAIQPGGEAVQGPEIAAWFRVRRRMSRQVLLRLSRAGIVRRVPGPSDGYVLARDPADISIAEVMEAGGGGMRMPSCEGPMEGYVQHLAHLMAPVWSEVSPPMRDRLSGTTLQDIVNRH